MYVGRGNLCALDMLSSSGLVNYFGKCDSLDKVEVSPLLMKKGETMLALYGLGCIRDERLHRLFEQQKVRILKPKENGDSWFNLFTIHQVSTAPTAVRVSCENLQVESTAGGSI